MFYHREPFFDLVVYNTPCYPTRECYYTQGNLLCHGTVPSGGTTQVPMIWHTQCGMTHFILGTTKLTLDNLEMIVTKIYQGIFNQASVIAHRNINWRVQNPSDLFAMFPSIVSLLKQIKWKQILPDKPHPLLINHNTDWWWGLRGCSIVVKLQPWLSQSSK